MDNIGTIGVRLREERERLRMNQTEFAALGGAAKRSQVRYEAGDKAPDARYLARVANSGTDVLYVVTGRRSAAGAPGSVDLNVLRQVIEGVEQYLSGRRSHPDPADKANAVTFLYEHFKRSGRVERGAIEHQLRLVVSR